MNVDSVAADVAAAAAELAGQGAAPAQATDDTPVAGEKTAEALHGRSPDEAGEHDQGKGQGRDEYGRYTPKPKTAEKVELVDPSKPKAEAPAKAVDTPAAPVKPDAAKAPEPAEKAAPEEKKAPETPALLPPRNLTPTAREEWPKLPRAMQQEFIRVNREAQTALTKSDKERQYAAGIRQVLQPYEHMLTAEGLDAPRAIGDLLKTAAMLRTGTPEAKAAWVADTIRRFNIGVEDVANALDGPAAHGQQGQPAAAHPAAPAQYHDPRVDQLIAQQQQFLAKQQAAAQAEAERLKSEMEEFGATHEFFEDIREDMADEMDRAARRGKPLTLEGAHARVLAFHKVDPDSEIGKVLRQRDEAAAAKAKLAQSQQARAAATASVKAEPVPVVVPKSKGDRVLDDVLAAKAALEQV